MRTAAEVITDTLTGLGTDTVFLLSGNQNLPLLDALGGGGVRLIHHRHENGVGYAGEAWAQLTDRPAVCLLTAGPGHLSGLTALAAAYASETPLLCLSGAAPTGVPGAFQELDQARLAAEVCRYADTLTVPARAAAAIRLAWVRTLGPVPGPTHLSLPVNVLNAEVDSVADASFPVPRTPPLAEDQVAPIRERWQAAERPVLLLRPSLGRALDRSVRDRLAASALVITADSPRGLKDPALREQRERLREADLVVVAGPLDYAVGFGAVGGTERVPVVVVTADPAEAEQATGRLGGHDLVRVGDELALVTTLAEARSAGDGGRAADREAMPAPEEREVAALHPLDVARAVLPRLTDRDVVVLDGGEYGQWLRWAMERSPATLVGNGKAGAIGGAIPQAIGASVARRDARVVAIIGDGSFAYYASEFDTAARSGLDILVLVGNDARWSAEWYQQHDGWGRAYATELEPRDYGLVAEGFGAQGRTADSVETLEAAVAAYFDGPPSVTCLNVRIDSVPVRELG